MHFLHPKSNGFGKVLVNGFSLSLISLSSILDNGGKTGKGSQIFLIENITFLKHG